MITNVLKNKGYFKNEDGETVLDLTQKSVSYSSSVSLYDVIIVKEGQEMRADKVSYAYYGVPDNYDMILKFNGISNPFSLAAGDVLLIPDIADMEDALVDNSNFTTAKDIRMQFLDPSKKSTIDGEKIKYNERMKEIAEERLRRGVDIVNPSISKLPPNFNEFNEKELTIKDNRVYFGPDLSKNKEMCQPMTKTQLISKLIKNRLKRENNDNIGTR